MAIDSGVTINCVDLQAPGGIKQILLRSWADTDLISYANAGVSPNGEHLITSISSGGIGTASWFNYDFKNQEPSMTINGTKENGSTQFEVGLSFTLPKMDTNKFHQVQAMLRECIMAIVIDSNGVPFVIGVSELYRNEAVAARSQTFANIATIEGGTGAAYNDDNGITVTLMAKQYELPRVYTGTIVLTGTDGATTT
tara:strand:+ start:52 stop:642 length:591 start_codon:yes stop_codon:yes gene_type:complete